MPRFQPLSHRSLLPLAVSSFHSSLKSRSFRSSFDPSLPILPVAPGRFSSLSSIFRFLSGPGHWHIALSSFGKYQVVALRTSSTRYAYLVPMNRALLIYPRLPLYLLCPQTQTLLSSLASHLPIASSNFMPMSSFAISPLIHPTPRRIAERPSLVTKKAV